MLPARLTAAASRTWTAYFSQPFSVGCSLRHSKTPKGRFDTEVNAGDTTKSNSTKTSDDSLDKKENINQYTGEVNGPKGPEPTRYGDWERKGRVSDF